MLTDNCTHIQMLLINLNVLTCYVIDSLEIYVHIYVYNLSFHCKIILIYQQFISPKYIFTCFLLRNLAFLSSSGSLLAAMLDHYVILSPILYYKTFRISIKTYGYPYISTYKMYKNSHSFIYSH